MQPVLFSCGSKECGLHNITKPKTKSHSLSFSVEACVTIFLYLCHQEFYRQWIFELIWLSCFRFVMSETISDSTRLAGHQRLRGRLGHIVSLPFCLHYQPLWNGVGGVREGGGVAGLSSLFDHWSPWPCLKGLNLSWPYQGMYFFFFLGKGDRVDVYQEWGCCGDIDWGVFLLEWR